MPKVMNEACLSAWPKLALNTSLFVAMLLFLYSILHWPFIIEAFTPIPLRLSIEGLVLFSLLLINLRYRYEAGIMWVLPVVVIFLSDALLGMDEFSRVASAFNKLVFLVLVTCLLVGNRRVLAYCVKLWVAISCFLCVMAILAFVLYNFHLASFPPVSMGAHGHYYFHNPVFGYLIPRTLFGVRLGRVTGYMNEGQQLAVFAGLNILLAGQFICNPSRRKAFFWLNMAMGITTLSTTFYGFFYIYFLFARHAHADRNDLMMRSARVLLLVLFGLSIVTMTNYKHYTSTSVREDRLHEQIEAVVNQATWPTVLFGHGVGKISNELGIGFDAGWLAVLANRGVILLGFLVVLYARFAKHDAWLLLYVFILPFAINMFWCPLFLLLVAMSYALHKDAVRRAVIPSLSSPAIEAEVNTSASPA